MTNRIKIITPGVLIIAVCISAWLYWQWSEQFSPQQQVTPPVYPFERTIQYSFTIRNDTSGVLNNAQFKTYAPVKQTATQRLESIQVSHSYTLSVDDLGNQLMLFEFERLAPYQSIIIRIRVNIALTTQPNLSPLESPERHLGPQPFIESDNDEIIKLADSFEDSESNELSRNLFNWVAANIEYAGYIAEDRGALYALRERKGDCTEYMYLYAALSRIKGIPTRSVAGYVYNGNPKLKASEYHNWAEIYQNGAWHIVDPQNKVFKESYENYIAMRIIGRDTQSSMNSERYSTSSDGLRVRMN